MRRRYRYRSARNRVGRASVSVSNATTRKRTKCAACALFLEVGEPVVRLRLRKSLRAPCGQCHRPLKGIRKYHPACAPADAELAMGVKDVVAQVVGAPVAPPPKPLTTQDATLAALLSLENALVTRLRNDPTAWEVVPDPKTQRPKRQLIARWEKAFTKFKGCKARVLRGSTPGEQEVATYVGLQQIVKLVFIGEGE